MTLCRVLTDLGVYPPTRHGRPSLYDSAEEALRVKKAQLKAAQIQRRIRRREAADAGEPPPIFKRGRPRIYATQEESQEVQKCQNREGRRRHEANIILATEALRELVASTRDAVRSTDQPKNVS